MQEKSSSITWRKTDLGLQGGRGFHLLEISHTKPIPIESLSVLVDILNDCKYESIKAQNQYPHMIYPALRIENIKAYQAQFEEQEHDLIEFTNIELTKPATQPSIEPTLSPLEDRALNLRVQWYKDEEIAEQMDIPLRRVEAIFRAIKRKYHQPRIPSYVYAKKRKQIFPELFI